ncbi:MAG: sensor histidine kinase [Bernardetiaceae bacterium]
MYGWLARLLTQLGIRFWINSRGVALLLASAVSLITLAFLSLVEDTPQNALLVGGLLSFAASFLLVFVTFEFLVFREISEVYERLEQIRGEGRPYAERPPTSMPSGNPIHRINQEIEAYAIQKQQEIEILKKNEVFRREFIADISHELKTPLFSAQGFVLTLLDGAMEDKKVRRRFLKKAAKSLEALNLLVEDLLTLSKIESGQIKMHYSVFDMEELVNEVFEQLESKAEKRFVNLHIYKSAEAVYVRADEQRIAQVINNLVINAIKYGKDNGHVWVRMETDDQRVIITVDDDGPGIPEEHLSRIFERFYRVDKSRSKKQGGSGLGLSIAKHIIHRHNSSISVSSELGIGTSFRFHLERA